MSKAVALAALKPLIFFDDNLRNCVDACPWTPTVKNSCARGEGGRNTFLVEADGAKRPERFLGVCKIFLRKGFGDHEPALRTWQQENLSELSDTAFESFTAELERSAKEPLREGSGVRREPERGFDETSALCGEPEAQVFCVIPWIH